MSVSAAIVPQMPYLRRFARALTGSQAGGDAYAAATLEAILAENGDCQTGDSALRPALYRILLKIWRSVSVNLDKPEPKKSDQAAAAARNLDAITPLPRKSRSVAIDGGVQVVDQVSAIPEKPVDEIES